jgi:hypothetical protein
VPIQCEYYALEGLGQLLRNVNLVQQNINPELRLTGIVMTMFDPRTKLSEQVVDEVRRFFGDVVYDVIIPRTVRLSEAPGFGQPITVYDPRSKGADRYRKLAKEVAARPRPEAPMPVFDELPTVVVQPLTTEEPSLEVVPEPEDEAIDEADEPSGSPTGASPPSESDLPEPADRMEPEPVREVEVTPEPDVREVEVTPEPEVREAEGLPAPPAPEVARTEPEADIWEEPSASAERKVRPPSATVAPGTLPERRVVVIGEDPEIDIEAGQEPLVQRQNGRVSPEGHEPVADIGGTLQDEGESPKRRWRLFRKGGG